MCSISGTCSALSTLFHLAFKTILVQIQLLPHFTKEKQGKESQSERQDLNPESLTQEPDSSFTSISILLIYKIHRLNRHLPTLNFPDIYCHYLFCLFRDEMLIFRALILTKLSPFLCYSSVEDEAPPLRYLLLRVIHGQHTVQLDDYR